MWGREVGDRGGLQALVGRAAVRPGCQRRGHPDRGHDHQRQRGDSSDHQTPSIAGAGLNRGCQGNRSMESSSVVGRRHVLFAARTATPSRPFRHSQRPCRCEQRQALIRHVRSTHGGPISASGCNAAVEEQRSSKRSAEMFVPRPRARGARRLSSRRCRTDARDGLRLLGGLLIGFAERRDHSERPSRTDSCLLALRPRQVALGSGLVELGARRMVGSSSAVLFRRRPSPPMPRSAAPRTVISHLPSCAGGGTGAHPRDDRGPAVRAQKEVHRAGGAFVHPTR